MYFEVYLKREDGTVVLRHQFDVKYQYTYEWKAGSPNQQIVDSEKKYILEGFKMTTTVRRLGPEVAG